MQMPIRLKFVVKMDHLMLIIFKNSVVLTQTAQQRTLVKVGDVVEKGDYRRRTFYGKMEKWPWDKNPIVAYDMGRLQLRGCDLS